MLEEKSGRLWCEACRKFVNFKEGASVKQHLFGSRVKGEDTAALFAVKPEKEKEKLKHYRNIAAAKVAAKDKSKIIGATIAFRQKIFEDSSGKELVKGSMVAPDAAADRVIVFKTLLEVGIPITKLENPKFVALIEKPHHSLGGLSGVRAVQPVVQEMVKSNLKAAIAGRKVSITFDGSKVNLLLRECLHVFSTTTTCQPCCALAARRSRQVLMLI